MFGGFCVSLRGFESKFKSYHDLIKESLCPQPTPKCHLLDCKECPGFSFVVNNFKNILMENNVTSLNYKQWTNTDRSTIELITSDADKFLDNLQEKANKLIPHSFIASKQVESMQLMKCNLKDGDILVILDFSENYSFVAQNAAQSFHWNNAH